MWRTRVLTVASYPCVLIKLCNLLLLASFMAQEPHHLPLRSLHLASPPASMFPPLVSIAPQSASLLASFFLQKLNFPMPNLIVYNIIFSKRWTINWLIDGMKENLYLSYLSNRDGTCLSFPQVDLFYTLEQFNSWIKIRFSKFWRTGKKRNYLKIINL